MVNSNEQRGASSPEEIAYKLLQDIVAMEGKQVSVQGDDPMGRDWYLEAFAECLLAVRDPENFHR